MAKTIPTLISYRDYMRATKSSSIFKQGRQEVLQRIDSALRTWHATNDDKDVLPEAKLNELLVIIAVCRNWLNVKADKDTATANIRRAAITSLLSQATIRMTYHIFQERKKAAKKKPEKPGTKELSEGYKNERDVYVKNQKKEDPLSGSSVNSLMQAMKGSPDDIPYFTKGMPPDVVALLRKDLSEISLAEYEKIFAAISDDETPIHRVSEAKLVQFFSKAQRMRFMYWVEDKILVNSDGPMDTKGKAWMYAMDQYGNLFATVMKSDRDAKEAAKWAEFEEDQRKNFNHSSFNAGKEVISAGMIKVNKGKIVEIDNNSGHYKPTAEHLNGCVQLLRELGMVIPDNAVKPFVP